MMPCREHANGDVLRSMYVGGMMKYGDLVDSMLGAAAHHLGVDCQHGLWVIGPSACLRIRNVYKLVHKHVMCIDMCISMCINVCMNMCIDTCIDMPVSGSGPQGRFVHRNGLNEYLHKVRYLQGSIYAHKCPAAPTKCARTPHVHCNCVSLLLCMPACIDPRDMAVQNVCHPNEGRELLIDHVP